MHVPPRLLARLSAWGPPIAWAALIFAASSAPVRTGRFLFHGADKVAHAVEYAVLGLLLARAILRTRPAWGAARVVLAAGAMAAAYGAADEIHQASVPEREADWGDGLADAAGGLAGAAAFALSARAAARGGPRPRPAVPPRP